MKKYYLIPMIDNSIYINDKSLRSILMESNPELVQREKERVDILYSVRLTTSMPESVKRKYNHHNAETKKMYDKLHVPQYLIAYGTDNSAEEILTRTKITSKYPAALGIRSISKEEAEFYYNSSGYHLNIAKFFKNKLLCELPFTLYYEIEGYIEGKINEQNIKGNFNGRIRIKK